MAAKKPVKKKVVKKKGLKKTVVKKTVVKKTVKKKAVKKKAVKKTVALEVVAAPDAKSVVEQFFSACQALDFDAALALIDDNCVYQNVPFHTARGKARIRRDLTSMSKSLKQFDIEMINIAVNEDVVLTERIDTLGGRFFNVALPLMGVLVVKNGKITQWRDYFDWSSAFGKFGRSIVSWPFR